MRMFLIRRMVWIYGVTLKWEHSRPSPCLSSRIGTNWWQMRRIWRLSIWSSRATSQEMCRSPHTRARWWLPKGMGMHLGMSLGVVIPCWIICSYCDRPVRPSLPACRRLPTGVHRGKIRRGHSVCRRKKGSRHWWYLCVCRLCWWCKTCRFATCWPCNLERS